MTDLPRVFIRIESGQEPDTYACVSIDADFLPGGVLRMGSGDFLADWKAVFLLMADFADKMHVPNVWLTYSSSVDWWEDDSCQFIETSHRTPDGSLDGPVTWRRATPEEEAALRQSRAELDADVSGGP